MRRIRDSQVAPSRYRSTKRDAMILCIPTERLERIRCESSLSKSVAAWSRHTARRVVSSVRCLRSCLERRFFAARFGSAISCLVRILCLPGSVDRVISPITQESSKWVLRSYNGSRKIVSPARRFRSTNLSHSSLPEMPIPKPTRLNREKTQIWERGRW